MKKRNMIDFYSIDINHRFINIQSLQKYLRMNNYGFLDSLKYSSVELSTSIFDGNSLSVLLLRINGRIG